MTTLVELVAARFDTAARVSAGLLAQGERTVLAVAVVGSTALGRCSPASDLDLVAIVRETPPEPVTSGLRHGVRVDVEWLSIGEAIADAGRSGWIWDMRKSARLGNAIALHDPEDLFPRLAALAAAARPDPARYAEALRDAARMLDTIVGECGGQADAFRGALDMLSVLVLLRTPRRYQKAKWTLDDLFDQGEHDLCAAIADAYGIAPDRGDIPIAAARRHVEASLAAAGEPDAATLVAMGHAPDHAAASYVARTLADADDRCVEGDVAAAQYTAGFAARLAAALPGCGSANDDYRACFEQGRVTARALIAARQAAARCRTWSQRTETSVAA